MSHVFFSVQNVIDLNAHKKMVSEGNTKWSTVSEDAAILFQDFYFDKFDPEDYDTKEIWETPNWPYINYLYKNFKTNIKGIVSKFQNLNHLYTASFTPWFLPAQG